MNDPHVVSLRYLLKTDQSLSYADAPRRHFENEAFKACLDKDVLLVELKDHFPSQESAKLIVDAWLKAWTVDASLNNNGNRQFWFEFEIAEVIDRQPPPPGSIVAFAGTARFSLICMPAHIHVTRNAYPEPPARFAAHPDVEIAWMRFRNYREGNEQLLSMAYACLTLLERAYHKRKGVSVMLNIDVQVLNKLGSITSTHGDPLTARKIDPANSPLTDAEKNWVEQAVLGMIRQLGMYHADPLSPLPRLTMSNLPLL